VREISTVDATRKEALLPSAGLVTLLWLLEACRVPCVSLAGFDHFSRDKDARHHYWLNGRYTLPMEHDGAAESMFVNDLERIGRVQRIGLCHD
jgi:hypothetical protein